jgi:hypothetical protein
MLFLGVHGDQKDDLLQPEWMCKGTGGKAPPAPLCQLMNCPIWVGFLIKLSKCLEIMLKSYILDKYKLGFTPCRRAFIRQSAQLGVTYEEDKN